MKKTIRRQAVLLVVAASLILPWVCGGTNIPSEEVGEPHEYFCWECVKGVLLLVPHVFWVGSQVDIENRAFMEEAPIAGTGLILSYASLRQPGYLLGKELTIPLTGTKTEAVWVHGHALSTGGALMLTTNLADTETFPTAIVGHTICLR